MPAHIRIYGWSGIVVVEATGVRKIRFNGNDRRDRYRRARDCARSLMADYAALGTDVELIDDYADWGRAPFPAQRQAASMMMP